MRRVILFLFLTFFCLTGVQAQQHREKWKANDYFPEHHFVRTYSNGRTDSIRFEDRAGEVAHYMRLAGLKPWKDTSLIEVCTLLRISMLPEYSHPVFIKVSIFDEKNCSIRLRRGKAICGYVEHTTYFEMSDTGYYDATEQHYRGNQWVEGFLDEGKEDIELWLTAVQIDTLNRLLAEVDLPHHPHTTCWGGFKTPYLIEYRAGKTYNAVYDECYDKPLGTLVNYLIALADSSCLDMWVHTPNSRNGLTPAQFPGGDSACLAFLSDNMRYPERGLTALEEYNAYVRFIVERDGSLTYKEGCSDEYGFCAEAKRLLSLMPRWQPALDKGRPVRSSATLSVRFTLPESIQPVYGNPHLETKRDSNAWNGILTDYRRLLLSPQDPALCYSIGKRYYHEHILHMKPPKTLNAWDTTHHDVFGESWESILDHTPVVEGAADSALRYFYRTLSVTDSVDLERSINMYLPIRQLEQYLGLPYNPQNKLPFDTVPGIHYPFSYFVELPSDGHLDPTVDYIFDLSLSSSYFWVNAFSQYLTIMSEPVLYDSTLTPGDTVFRFAFYPSFHPPLCFRVERSGDKAMLFWTKLDYTIDESTLTVTYNPIQGNRELSKNDYSKLMSLFAALDFDNKPRFEYQPMTDGAQWIIERRTADTFKATFTNMAGRRYDALYSYLISLACIDADYASEYCD